MYRQPGKMSYFMAFFCGIITTIMTNYVDSSKITFRSNEEEMRKFFFWYHSKEKESYVSWTGVHQRCEMPCDIDHPYYWSNIPFNDHYNDRDLREDDQAIGCFGCSNTFGSYLQVHDTWPYLLGKKLKTNCINFGVGGAGIDSVYLNLKASSKDYKFKKVIIVLPTFDRRVSRICHLGNWFRWPTLAEQPILWKELLPPPVHKDLRLDNEILLNHGKYVEKKIIDDVEHKYQKKVLERLVKFCRKTYTQFYITSWSDDVYEYLNHHYTDCTIHMYDYHGPKASDGLHPTVFQNRRFVQGF